MSNINPIEDWEFNVLDIYNFRKKGKLVKYFDFIKKYHNKINGDICEVGVYRGFSIISTALLLRELGSDKLVYGYDSFSGFPTYHQYDDLSFFDSLLDKDYIDPEHYRKFKLNLEYKNLLHEKKTLPSNISTSGDFSSTSKEFLENKIKLFGLNNIVLVDGDYASTMNDYEYPDLTFMAVLMDCDLYESHKIALPFTWQRLSKKGYMFLDEYFSLKFPGARYAIDNFFNQKKQKPKMHKKIPLDFERWYVRK